MSTSTHNQMLDTNDSTLTAVQAYERGFTPISIAHKEKRPYGSGWQTTSWESVDQVTDHFEESVARGYDGVGLLLGKPSNGLLDVDLDSPAAVKMAAYFLPQTPMVSGHESNPRSHRWYLSREAGPLPETRRYAAADRTINVEIRSTGAQTVIPPSTHPSGEAYVWEGEPFGGKRGPARVDARVLAVQVALVGLGAVLVDAWPKQGSRHDAYLALAGGLLRHKGGIHPYWEANLATLIEALVDATHDEEGAEKRLSQVFDTTVRRLREGGKAAGFPRLGELIGEAEAESVRSLAREVAMLAGFDEQAYALERVVTDQTPSSAERLKAAVERGEEFDGEGEWSEDEVEETTPSDDPLEDRITTWDAVDLEPYIMGRVVTEPPNVLRRDDGKALFYPGKVNMIFGPSESAKTWIMLYATRQHVEMGERALYIDMEDDPIETVKRLMLMGAEREHLERNLTYIRPEEPIAAMQRDRYGKPLDSPTARAAQEHFAAMLEARDPTLIVVDGMTAVYSLHGLDTNDSVGTETINRWLKSLTRSGRTTVVVIDHTTKGGGKDSAPIGSQHKTSMISGASIRATAIDRPVPGRVGVVELSIQKDRPGQVRRYAEARSDNPVVAVFTIDSTDEERSIVEIAAPSPNDITVTMTEETFKPIERLDQNTKKVLALMYRNPDAHITTTDIVNATGLERREVYPVWHTLKGMGLVAQEGTKKATRFTFTDKARREQDEHDPEFEGVVGE